MRLNKIYIEGFKDPKRKVDLTFSNEDISVIYGVNGSGKTTLLRLLNAIFSKDENQLRRENVSNVQLYYTIQQQAFLLEISKEKKKYEWKGYENFDNTTSIFFETNRGIVGQSIQENEFLNTLHEIINQASVGYYSQDMIFYEQTIIEETKKYFKNQNLQPRFPKEKRHISADFIKMADIEKALVTAYQKGQNIVLEKINNAFFETIENALILEEEGGQIMELPDNFEKRLAEKQDFVRLALNQQKETQIVKRLKKYVETGDRGALNHSKILRALLINILEKAEEKNPTLEAIKTLTTAFNEHLYYDKKIVIEEEHTYILFQSGRTHNLTDLSSGERHLLSLLTLFLILGRNRNFFLIDEPEISLNIKWQRQLLPLLSKLSPQSQIIAATHSPAIANQNTNYLVELI